MGKTGRLGPAPTPPEETRVWQLKKSGLIAHAATLYGSDLYRLNCRGCHGEFGLGAPPEINSVINPVRATSVAAIMERMKNAGVDMNRADAAELAKQSKIALLQRLHNGGQDMPPFPHLSEAEIRSLFAYLRQLAGVPGAEREQIGERESPVRVGEHIVKSTCHICHSAAGPNPTPQQLLDGAIPPLNTLSTRTSLPQFVRKVVHGMPIVMGMPPMLCRGRMPVFYYLSEDEAADAYLYLSLYPRNKEGQPTADAEHADKVLSSSSTRLDQPEEGPQPGKGTVLELLPLRIGVVLVPSLLLLAGGMGFTVFEFRRLSAEIESRNLEEPGIEDGE